MKEKIQEMEEQLTDQQSQTSVKVVFCRIAVLFMMVCMMCVPAFATDEAVTVSGLLTSSGTLVTSAMSTVWSIVTANDFLKALLGCSLLAIGFRFFRAAKRAARH